MTAVAAAGDHAAGPRKGGGAETTTGSTTPPPTQHPPPPPPAEQVLRCPRCDSPNTKFCYYNNYSLSQPRHFCKACRRYWTKGGALRNVPVGGGCRKNRRSRSASAAVTAAASSRFLPNQPAVVEGGFGVRSSAAADRQAAAMLGLLGGGAPVTVSSPIGGAPAAANYPCAAAGTMAPPRIRHAPAVAQYAPSGREWPSPGAPAPDVITTGGAANGSGTGHAVNAVGAASGSVASCIESLSFINQDLHWKLQQQRLAAMFLLAKPASSAGAADSLDGAFLHVAACREPGTEAAAPPTTPWFAGDSCYVLTSAPPPPPSSTAAAMATTAAICGGGDQATSNNYGSGISS